MGPWRGLRPFGYPDAGQGARDAAASGFAAGARVSRGLSARDGEQNQHHGRQYGMKGVSH